MASHKLLKDCVTLFTYAGEENKVAKFHKTILHNVLCVDSLGVKATNQGDSADNNATLYIFDTKVIAESQFGVAKEYMPFEKWLTCHEQDKYWTLRDDEKDFFVKGICESETPKGVKNVFSITKSIHYTSGTSRMWHWEINGR